MKKAVFAHKTVALEDHSHLFGSRIFKVDVNTPHRFTLPTYNGTQQPVAMVSQGPIRGYDAAVQELLGTRLARVQHVPDWNDPCVSMEALVDTAIALDGIYGHVKRRSHAQPLTRAQAATLNVAIEGVCAKFDPNAGPVFALEHFTSKQASVRATQVALEGLSEKIRRICQKIIDWIKRMVQGVLERLDVALNGAEAVESAANALRDVAQKLKALKGDRPLPKDAVFVEESFARFLTTSGASDWREIAQRYEHLLTDFSHDFSAEKLTTSVNHIADVAQTVLSDELNEDYTNAATAGAVDQAIGWLLDNSLHTFEFQFADGVKEGRVLLPFGSAILVARLTERENYRLGLEVTVHSNGAPNRLTELAVMTPSAVLTMLQVIERAVSKGAFADHAKIRAELKKLDSIIEQTCKQIASRELHQDAGGVASLHLLKQLSDSVLKLCLCTFHYTSRVNKHLVAYCEASLRYYQAYDFK